MSEITGYAIMRDLFILDGLYGPDEFAEASAELRRLQNSRYVGSWELFTLRDDCEESLMGFVKKCISDPEVAFALGDSRTGRRG